VRELFRLVRKVALSLGGEGIQSAFHFLLNLALIRALSPYDYGVFAIVFVTGAIALTYGNALVSTPAAVRLPRASRTSAANYQDALFGSVAVLLACGIGAAVFIGVLLAMRDLQLALASGAFTGLWVARNHVRTVMFTRRRTGTATVSDFGYVASGVGIAVAQLSLVGRPGAADMLWGLAAANLLGMAGAFALPKSRVRLAFRRSMWRRYLAIRDEVSWSVLSTTTWNVQGYALTFLVAAVAGPAAYAPIAAAMLLFAPLRLFLAALINVFRPEIVVALAERRYRDLSALVYAVAGAVAAGGLGLGGAFWAGWPLVEGYVFAAAYPDVSLPLIAVLSGATAMIYMVCNVPLILLQSASDFRSVAIATSIGAITAVAAVSALLSTASVEWSVAGMAAGEAVCGLYLWVAARRILRSGAARDWRGSSAAVRA
jgi:O-antigen/teichoic acid export membrane protein